MIKDVEAILKACGIGSYLHIGDTQNTLVFDLLKRSMDAYGIDSSPETIAKNLEYAPGRFLLGSLQNYPFQPGTFDNIIIGSELLQFSEQDIPVILNALLHMTKRNLIIYLPNDALHNLSPQGKGNRLFWERAAIAAGFRRHTREMLINTYESLEDERVSRFTFFERIPEAALQQFPMAWLLANRDLHMDMLREAGRRSDGHVSRYVLAASRISAGDIVLDAACGLGYGTAVLAACSPGATFIGVDIDPESTAYAQANYAATNSALSYRACDITNLSFLADHSVDAVVSFETIEHIQDYDLFLAEVKRVLKPDGRMIGSVPNLWCDETGKDPNPHHFHVFDWDKLNRVISNYFIVDGRIAQTAGGGYKLRHGKRELARFPVNYPAPIEAEWLLFTANVDPRKATEQYVNPFCKDESTAPTHVQFGKYYDNPWIYRVLVQQGVRLLDDGALSDFCVKLISEVKPGSADHGAALCVIAYRLLESDNVPIKTLSLLVGYINTFDQAYDRNNPHAYRWALSLQYVAGRLLLSIGNREEALATFLTCAAMDAAKLSPLLATKTLAARMYAGMILVGNGKLDEARDQFRQGIKEAHRVMQGDWKNIIGDFDQPLQFGLPEAAEVLHLASQCAGALEALNKQTSVPGLFWDCINLKFFGLVEWNRNLEKENGRLHHELQRMITANNSVPVTI